MSNVKAGDLAYYAGVVEENLGRIVNVLYSRPWEGRAAWVIDRPLIHDQARSMLTTWIADSVLRPIRDPGDDAQDESLTWKPAPEKALIKERV